MPSEVFVGNDLADGGTVKSPKYQLYITNGQAGSGTKSLTVGSGSSGMPPSYVTRSGRFIYVELTSPSGASEIWATDGTTITQLDPGQNGGSYTVSGFYPGPTAFTTASGVNEIAFIGNNLAAGGTAAAPKYQLFVSNGTAGGTKAIGPSFTTVPYMQEVSGNLVYFSAPDQFGGTELWVTDGTSVFELDPNLSRATNTYRSPGYPVAFTTSGGVQEVAFTANSGTSTNPKYQIYVSNGTPGGTKPVSGGFTSLPYNLTVSGSRVYFEVDTANGAEIWATDGSTAAEVDPGTNGGSYAVNGGYPYLTAFVANGVSEVAFIGNNPGAGGTSASPKYQIYVSNGTAGGTKAIGPTFASQPSVMGVSGNLVYFSASDQFGGTELWVTDGTSVSELDPNPSRTANTYLSPGYPVAFTTSGGVQEVAFTANSGTSTNPKYQLYVSNGTAGGTKPVSPAFVSSPYYFVVSGSRVYFEASTAAGTEIWATDGSTVTEIDPGTSGGSYTLDGVYPYLLGFTTVGLVQEVAFVGNNLAAGGTAASPKYQAYVSNGQAGGTHAVGPTFTSQPVLEQVNGGLLYFEATDSRGGLEYWATDGTNVTELDPGSASPPVSDSYAADSMAQIPTYAIAAADAAKPDGRTGLTPYTFTVSRSDDTASRRYLNYQALVSGGSVSASQVFSNASGQIVFQPGVSVTTLTLYANPLPFYAGQAFTVTLSGALDPVGMVSTSSSSIAAAAASGTLQKNAVNVTPSLVLQNIGGTVFSAVLNGFAETATSTIGPPSAAWHVLATGDLNGDGNADLILQNDNGQIYAWLTNGARLAGSGALPSVTPDWHVKVMGDLNGDGDGDIVLQDDNGAVQVWEMSGTTIVASATIANPGAAWHVVGAADLNGDGKADIILQNDNGQVDAWLMNGTTTTGGGAIGTLGADWHVVGTGDLNGDGRSDIVLQNSSGAVYGWEMNGTAIAAQGTIGNAGAAWHVQQVEDLNGDGKADIIWQNASSGQIYAWEMNGTAATAWGAIQDVSPDWHVAGTGTLGWPARADLILQSDTGAVQDWGVNGTYTVAQDLVAAATPDWHVLATGDLNGDRSADIILQNDSGAVYAWERKDNNIITQGTIGNPGPAWHVVGTGDLNGDGRSDIVVQNDNGQVYVWEMNGTTIAAQGAIGNLGVAWHVVGIGDLNGDGRSDIVLQNASGAVYGWEMNGTAIAAQGTIGNPGAAWHVVGTGDLNGDGRADIVLQNDNGQIYAWEMNGTAIAAQGTIGNPGAAWHVVGTEDVNGDGRADVVLQNASGQVYAWEMNGTTMVGWGSVANAAVNLHVAGERTMRFISSADGANLTATSLPDTFTFFSYTAATSTISGFNPAQDIVELNQAHFAAYGAVQAAITADGTGSAVIHLDSTHSLTLTGIGPASLSAANFQFA